MQRFLMVNPTVALNALRLMARRLRRHAELADSLALKDVGQAILGVMLAIAGGLVGFFRFKRWL